MINFAYIISFWLIPINLCTDKKYYDQFNGTELYVDIIIFLDIIVNLISQRMIDSELIIFMRDNIINYLKTYFIIDFFSCMPGLITLESIQNLYFAKLIRILRMKRFFCFFKMINKFISGIFS